MTQPATSRSFYPCLRSHPTISLALTLVYIVLGLAVYVGFEEWTVLETIYFEIVVLTTVGYGDVSPSLDHTKVFTCFYVLFALVIAVFAISFLMEAAMTYAEQKARELQVQRQEEGIFAQKKHARQRRFRTMLKNVALFGLLILVGSLFFGTVKDWEDSPGDKWVNSIYLSVITLTTEGFGDFSASSDAEKVFCCFYMVIGIPSCGACLATFTEYIFGEQKDDIRLGLVQGGLKQDKFESMEAFCKTLSAANCIADEDDDSISRFEFLSFLLVENDIVDMENITDAMSNFRALDVQQDGHITRDDVKHWLEGQSLGPAPPALAPHVAPPETDNSPVMDIGPRTEAVSTQPPKLQVHVETSVVSAAGSNAEPLARINSLASVKTGLMRERVEKVNTQLEFLATWLTSGHRQTLVSLGMLLVYFIVGVVYYSVAEDWGVGDCIYFAIVVLTTVGYGDLLPTTDRAKLFTCVYVILALVVAAFAVSDLLDAATTYAAEKAAAMKQSIQSEESPDLFALGKQAKARRLRQFIRSVMLFMLLLVIGTLFFGIAKDWDAGGASGDKWVNSFYLSVITLSTEGFGDFSSTSPGEKVFNCFFMLIGVPVFGACLAAFTDYIFGEQKDEVHLKLVQGALSIEKFDGMEDFCRKLADVGGGELADDGRISRFEFLCFVLFENGVIEMSNIQIAMLNFSELDVTGTGFISKMDVEAWVSARNGPPAKKNKYSSRSVIPQ